MITVGGQVQYMYVRRCERVAGDLQTPPTAMEILDSVMILGNACERPPITNAVIP